MAAKKGTAETIFEGSELPTIGKSGTGELPTGDFVNWFAGWTEGQDEPLVVVTMIEGGGAFHSNSGIFHWRKSLIEGFLGAVGLCPAEHG